MLLKAFPLAESRCHGGFKTPLRDVYLPIKGRLFTIKGRLFTCHYWDNMIICH